MSAANSHEVRLHIGNTGPPAKTITMTAKGRYRLRRVPQWVREAHKEAYAPKFMCFGPYHYYYHVGLRHEELKGRYAAELLKDAAAAEPHDELRQICEQRLTEMICDIREFYADLGPPEAAEMTTEAWVKMMFLDGCFILKHLCNYVRGTNEEELHQSRWAPAQLRSDLTLLENQIPFAVLFELFNHLAPRDLLPRSADKKKRPTDMASSPWDTRRRLLDMALWYMFKGSLPPGKRPTDELGVDAEAPVEHLLHLLHLAHCAQLNATQERRRPPERDLRGFVSTVPIRLMRLLRCLCMFDYEPGPGGNNDNDGHMTENVPSAAELKAMGIWITRTTTTTTTGTTGPHHDGTLLDVRFMEDRVRLEIPTLYVEQTTAPLLQNLIAFEQQVGVDGSDYYTTYAFLMYNLVSTREDITLLQDLRILHNNFGSDKKVINYFKNLCVWNRRSGSTPIDKVLKDLRRCRVLHVYRDLAEVKNYINSPVKILLLIISAMVALSTVMQALMAIRPPTGH
ncbi:unnamed protein product [Miscanthus lutarioriparius]|uniref:Uncharacterized protein n=1 Tax=Miscanthus lutarioriparius TaxID=422564 RepID=A0A811QVJ4_9POAL|nr:unnamed protein product [Miscanthus lutarioriparius]